MNGAESLVRTLTGGGVTVCFANPGTSEMHFVAALDRVPEMRCVLALHEAIATGASPVGSRVVQSTSCESISTLGTPDTENLIGTVSPGSKSATKGGFRSGLRQPPKTACRQAAGRSNASTPSLRLNGEP